MKMFARLSALLVALFLAVVPAAADGPFSFRPAGGAATVTSGTIASAIGQIDVGTWAGVTVGTGLSAQQRLDNAVAIQAAFDACDAQGRVCALPVGSLEYTATGMQGATRTGLQLKKGAQGLIGAGSLKSKLVQFATNYPALTIGDRGTVNSDATYGARFLSFGVGFGTSQSGQTSGSGLVLGRIWGSEFNDLDVDPYIAGGARVEAYIGLNIPNDTAGFFFSNRVDNIRVRTGLQSIMVYAPASSTGNDWGSVYLGGGTFNDWRDVADSALSVNSGGTIFGHIRQLNIEWVRLPNSGQPGLVFVNGSNGFSADVLYYEGNVLRAFSPRLLHVSVSQVHVKFMGLLDNRIASGEVSGTPAIIGSYGDANVRVESGFWKWNSPGNNSDGIASATFQIFSPDTSLFGARPRVSVRNVTLTGHNIGAGGAAMGVFNIDPTLAASVAGNIRSFGEYAYDPGQSYLVEPVILAPSGVANIVVRGSTRRAKVLIDTSMSADRKVIWSDVSAPSGFGATVPTLSGDVLEVVRSPNATGAFNVNIRDSADANTITSVTAASQVKRVNRNGSTLTGY